MVFLKKNWGNLVFIVVIALLFIPQTAMPIKVFVAKIISFSPSELDKEERKVISNYNWELVTLEGEQSNFANSEGKVVVINFWATWCPPCVAEMPSLQNLYDTYKDKVDFYFVTSEELETVQRFLQKKKYTFPVYIETNRAPKELLATSLPTTFIISKEGEIVVQKSGAATWDSDKVKAIINNLLEEN